MVRRMTKQEIQQLYKTEVLLKVKHLSPKAQYFLLMDLAWKAQGSLVKQSLVNAQTIDGIDPYADLNLGATEMSLAWKATRQKK